MDVDLAVPTTSVPGATGDPVPRDIPPLGGGGGPLGDTDPIGLEVPPIPGGGGGIPPVGSGGGEGDPLGLGVLNPGGGGGPPAAVGNGGGLGGPAVAGRGAVIPGGGGGDPLGGGLGGAFELAVDVILGGAGGTPGGPGGDGIVAEVLADTGALAGRDEGAASVAELSPFAVTPLLVAGRGSVLLISSSNIDFLVDRFAVSRTFAIWLSIFSISFLYFSVTAK